MCPFGYGGEVHEGGDGFAASRAAGMRMIEILEQKATHFLVASNYWGSDCLINWVAFEPL